MFNSFEEFYSETLNYWIKNQKLLLFVIFVVGLAVFLLTLRKNITRAKPTGAFI